MISVSKNYVMANAASGLTQLPLLALTANDHLAPHTHVDTDHSWSDHRIALESIVITWLAGLH